MKAKLPLWEVILKYPIYLIRASSYGPPYFYKKYPAASFGDYFKWQVMQWTKEDSKRVDDKYKEILSR